MKYPDLLFHFNKVMGVLSGALILIIGLLSVMEVIMRGVFSSPTFWSMDVSRYVLIWAIFLGTSYSYQEKGHVAVDFIRDAIGRRWSEKARRAMSLMGHFLSLLVIAVLLWTSVEMSIVAVELKRLTIANVQVPIILLYSAIVVGSAILLLTVAFAVIDLLGGGEKYQ